jgi:hypothetical protein
MPFFIPAFIAIEELIHVAVVLGGAVAAAEAVEHAPRIN